MNQRGRLIPSIAKSITFMLKLSNNRSLRTKLANTGDTHRSDNGTSASPNNNDTNKVLQTRLWHIAQKRLYNTPTPKQLNYRRFFLEWGHYMQHQDDDMLLENSIEGTDYIGDASDDYNNSDLEFGLLTHPGDEPVKLTLDEPGEYCSSIIFEDSEFEYSAAMPDNLPDAGINQDAAATITDKFARVPSNHALSESFGGDEIDLDISMHESNEEPPSQRFSSRFLTEIVGEESGEMLLDEIMED
ncbi:hypothetical protein BJX63DRAFT_432315 [Aspergillus granulosus]|uniref:Uncharacterized protein n=1 Tax=Aspergillus granulosus TaxID=176169 RepID=A0ABR4HBN8_9EURO